MEFQILPNSRAEALWRVIREKWDDAQVEAEWAYVVHLSRFHFQRLFLRYMGETPGELRRRLRLERAAHTLCTSRLDITTTAFDAGYESVEGFSRAFHRAYGIAPSHYRRLPFPRLHLPCSNGIHYDAAQGQPSIVAPTGVKNMDILDRLIDHDVWMTRKMLERAATLTDTNLDAPLAVPHTPMPFESEEGTLREALNRLVFTKEIWLASMRGQPFPQGEQDTTIAGMLKRLDVAFIEFAEVARRVRDENRWDETFVDADSTPPLRFSYGGMIAHVVTFSAFRRSAALKILEKLGVNDLGYGDPIEWEREVARPQ